MGLTAPLVIFGAVAAKSFITFEKKLSEIEGLVGIAGDQVEAMGKKANTMASAFGKSGVEASEALFFITSAGLRGKEAMDVLEQSLKASVIGLGETKVIADLATSAMNAYGSEVLSASNATDVLTKSVREGKLNAATLGAAMGQVLPIASAMGVTFNEVGATFAAMSRTGTDAATAATQLKGILASILSPATEAEKALAKMGLSSEQLRTNIKEKGLLNTLELLNDKFDGNEAAAAAVFGNIRALSGVMDLMGKNVDGTRAIFDSLNDSMGATDEAFKIASNTADFKLKKALFGVTNNLKAFGNVITNLLLPKLEQLSGFIKRTFEAFEKLSPGLQRTIVKIGLVVLALGPLLVGFGFLMTTVIPGLITAFGFLTATALPAVIGAFKTLNAVMAANPIIAIGVAIGLLVSGFVDLLQKISPVVTKLKTFFNLVKAGFDQGRFIQLQMQDVADAMEEEGLAAAKASRELRILAMNEKLAANNAAKLKKELKGTDKIVRSIATNIKDAGAGFQLLGKPKQEKIALDKHGKPVGGVDESGVFTNLIPIQIISEGLEELKLRLKQFNDEANELITGSIAETFGKLGESIGEALATGGDVLQAVGQTILASLGKFLSEMGGMLVKYGTLAVLKGKLDLAILAGGPVAIGAGLAAIAVGIALKAAGAAIGQAAQSGSSDFAGGTGGGGSSRRSGFSGSQSGFSSGGGTVVFELAGTKLIGVIQNTLNRNKALGGNNNLLLS